LQSIIWNLNIVTTLTSPPQSWQTWTPSQGWSSRRTSWTRGGRSHTDSH